MSALVSHDPRTRTTTLVFGPLAKPLSEDDHALVAKVLARAAGLGYAVLKAETDNEVTLTAVLSAPRSQPFTGVLMPRVSDVQKNSAV